MADFYTVSQINAYIKNIFERDFALSRIVIRGEVSNCKYHQKGHIYFTLKDSGAQISCIMFARDRESLGFRLSNGQQVDVSGQVSIYEKSGRYQLYVKSFRLSGAGELYEKYLELKNRLEETGMFDPMYKKPIPRFVRSIGIVTAPTGAAIQDIENITRRRNPYIRLILYPALVQGEGAKESIAKGIRYLDELKLDVIIVGRGGGSIEDLWAFNEELVAQAIFNAKTPVISAIGHQTDFTIADFAADLRAETPSGAAELASFEYDELMQELDSIKQSLYASLNHKKELRRHRLEADRERLLRLSPENQLANRLDRVKDIKRRMCELLGHKCERQRTRFDAERFSLKRLMELSLTDKRNNLKLLTTRLDALSPLKKMSGGYGYLMTKEGKAIKNVRDIRAGEALTAYISDGKISARVTEAKELSYGRK